MTIRKGPQLLHNRPAAIQIADLVRQFAEQILEEQEAAKEMEKQFEVQATQEHHEKSPSEPRRKIEL